jgi:TorA maturation chaperone TorD
MNTTAILKDELADHMARECLYRFLAALLADPRSCRWALVPDRHNQQLARNAADLLRSEAIGPILGFGELPVDDLDLVPLERELEQSKEEWVEEYDRVFGIVHARECPPYETEYHENAEPFFRSQQLADIAGFYRAFGLTTARAVPERPDHVSLELEFMALLSMNKRLALEAESGDRSSLEAIDVCEQAERAFLRDHLAWWLPSFCTGLRRKAGDGLYAAAGRILAAWLPIERQRLGVRAGRLSLVPKMIEPPDAQMGCIGC